jgi:hypothetical protein
MGLTVSFRAIFQAGNPELIIGLCSRKRENMPAKFTILKQSVKGLFNPV